MNEFNLPVRSRADFRAALAGIADPDRKLTEGDKGAFKQKADRLVIALCLHFGDELDRKTLWSRIDSGLQSACSKVSDADMDRWLDLLLEHVKADPSKAASCGYLSGVRSDLTLPDEAHRKAFMRYVETRRYAVMANGRSAWEKYKAINPIERRESQPVNEESHP